MRALIGLLLLSSGPVDSLPPAELTPAMAKSPPAKPPILGQVVGGTAAALSSVPTALRSLLVVNEGVRGRDQRAIWLRALAMVHPRLRVSFLLCVLAIAIVLRLRPGWQDPSQCVAVRLGPALSACRAALGVAAVSLLVAALAIALVLEARRGMAEQRKDEQLSDDYLVAAAASAAYEFTPENRLRELNIRGVESGNWAVDEEFVDEDIAVFVNRHEQAVIIAFKGTSSLSDWASNMRRIIPGDEEKSATFQRAVQVSKRVRDKYILFNSIRLTGHSRGGSMADFVGRKLGLPSSSFNPASWGKVLRSEEPAASSVSHRTADLVSVLEAFFPKDRRVMSRPPKHWPHLLVGPVLSVLCFVLASRARRAASKCELNLEEIGGRCWQIVSAGMLSGGEDGVWLSAETAAVLSQWMRRSGTVAIVLSFLAFMAYEHTVLNFTLR